MTDSHHEAGRSVPERVGALEQDMHLVKHRLDRFDRHHEDLPMRVGRLELIAQTQSELLKSLDVNVREMGKKVMYGLGAAGAIISVVQIFGPHLLRAVTS